MENEKKLYKEALTKWGIPAQIDRCIEEMAELTKALLEMRRERDKSNLGMRYVKVYQEIGDVEIILAQLREYFDPVQIDEYKQIKLRDLKKRLKDK